MEDLLKDGSDGSQTDVVKLLPDPHVWSTNNSV